MITSLPSGVLEKILEQHTIALGKTGSGKSSAIRVIVEHILDHERPAGIIDPKGDWWGLKSSRDGKRAGYPVVIFGGDHADVPINERAGKLVAELVGSENRPFILDLSLFMPTDRASFMVDFLPAFFMNARGVRWLVCDEVHNLAPQGKVLDPQHGKLLYWMNRLASEGRGKGIRLIAASQRPQKVHKDFITQAETLIAMRVIHPLDRDAIKEWLDGAGGGAPAKEVLNTIADLSVGQAWVWSPTAKFGPERVQFPMFQTYDSFKAQTSHVERLKGWADVNLEAVNEKLAAVKKEAEANDPKALKARVATLERELATTRASKAKGLPTTTPAEVERQITRAVAASLDGAEKVITERDALIKRLRKNAAAIQPFIADMLDPSTVYAPYVRAKATPAQPGPAMPPPRAIAVRAAAEMDRTFTKNAAVVSGEVSGPELKILTALSELYSIKKTAPAREMVGPWAGYSSRSGGFKNLLSQLRTKGFLEYPSEGSIRLTTDGHNIVGPKEPPDQAEINRRIEAILSDPEIKVLTPIIQLGKDGKASREQIGDASGYSPTSGGFKNILSSLRTAGFITYPSDGTVSPADWIFVD